MPPGGGLGESVDSRLERELIRCDAVSTPSKNLMQSDPLNIDHIFFDKAAELGRVGVLAPGTDPESLPLSLGIALLLLFSAVPAPSSGLITQTVFRIKDGGVGVEGILAVPAMCWPGHILYCCLISVCFWSKHQR